MSKRASILRFYEDLAEDYDRRFKNPRLDYMREVEKKYILESFTGGKILDIGCGTGEQSLFLAKRGYRVIGVDISREMLMKAEKNAKQVMIDDRLSFVIASAEALPFRDRSFDGLISIFGVFNHIPGVDNAFRETHRIIRSGGRAVFTVVNRWNLTWWINALLKCKIRWLISSIKSREYTVNGLWTYYFSRNELKNFLKKTGYKVKIGSMLIFIYPFNSSNLIFYEKLFIIIEDAVRWKSPFNGLGYYLLIILEK